MIDDPSEQMKELSVVIENMIRDNQSYGLFVITYNSEVKIEWASDTPRQMMDEILDKFISVRKGN